VIKDGILIANQLYKNFGNTIAVNNVSFTVNKGEIFGFLGPNGAGKTTTIKMLTGLIRPNRGNVIIDGIDIQKKPIEAKLKLGIIPELSNIYNDLSAIDNLVLTGQFYGYSKKKILKNGIALLERFELAERMYEPVKKYSKGMKQRVNIACGLIHEPRILILDEPMSGLDVKSQRLIKSIIKQVNQKGTTVILSTHNLEEANVLCDRIGIINKGSIITIDSPENLKSAFNDTQSLIVSFDNITENHSILKNSDILKIEKIGDKWHMHTECIDKLLKSIVHHAQEEQIIIKSLEICTASLEDVFVKLTES
jgi:ABC-2 type transport system ATP-binding protein